MRFTTLALGDAEAVVAAARAGSAAHLVLLAPGARALPDAFGGLGASLGERLGVLGGAMHAAGARHFGWMLAPSAASPLPFELVPISAPLGEAGADARARGAIDVVAPGMVLAARELLLEPLPADPVAAMVELCARARAAGRDVVCRPSFACEAAPLDADDRGRFAALRTVGERYPELHGTQRIAAAARRTLIDREVRLPGGRRTRARMPMPPLTVLVHGTGAELAARRARELSSAVTARAVSDAAAALRAEMRVRGDRYVLVAEASHVPDAAAFFALVEAVEAAPYVAMAAPDAASLDGRCALLALARFPQHVEAAGETLADALRTLAAAARALRRAVRAPGAELARVAELAHGAITVGASSVATSPNASIIFAAASAPEILKLTLTAVVEASRPGDELIAVCAPGAATTRRIVASFPQARVADDAADPLLTVGVNRALGAAASGLIVVVADDVLVPAGVLDRLRDAFARVPSLGAAFPAVPGALGGEGVVDVQYADIAELRALAEQRAAQRAREIEPVDVAISPVFAVAREALAVVGGIDPSLGLTRRGIADLMLRLRAAGYGVVRCDDALAHRFDATLSRNPAAAADTQQPVPAADPAAIARGFDPVRRVPFANVSAAANPIDVSTAIAVPVAGAAELERAAMFLAAAARAFDARSPVRVDVLLDGSVTPADAVARVRPALAACGKPMDATLAVRIECASDLAAWRAAADPYLRLLVAAGHERDALGDLTAVHARSLSELLQPVTAQ